MRYTLGGIVEMRKDQAQSAAALIRRVSELCSSLVDDGIAPRSISVHNWLGWTLVFESPLIAFKYEWDSREGTLDFSTSPIVEGQVPYNWKHIEHRRSAKGDDRKALTFIEKTISNYHRDESR